MAGRKALGKGIGALIPGKPVDDGSEESIKPPGSPTTVPSVVAPIAAAPAGEPRSCGVEEIISNRFQPRRTFADDALTELADSIEERGILEPLVVRAIPDDAKTEHTRGAAYELIAGERRWRAAQKVGLSRVPIVIHKMTDQEALEAALIENVMREDLTAIEEAEGYQRLLDTAGMTQEILAERIGKNRSHVSNTLRLLKLPSRMRDDIGKGKISAGHGRAILALEDSDAQGDLYREILNKNLSVRQAELWTKKAKAGSSSAKPATARKDPHFESLGRELSQELGAKVTITPKGGRGGSQGGKVVISASSPSALDRVISRLRGERE